MPHGLRRKSSVQARFPGPETTDDVVFAESTSPLHRTRIPPGRRQSAGAGVCRSGRPGSGSPLPRQLWWPPRFPRGGPVP